MHYDPTKMIPLDSEEFRLMFWEIHKSELKLPASDLRDKSLKALTVVNTSAQERRQIREWCRSHGSVRTFRTQVWEDSYDKGGIRFDYCNQEFPILAHKDHIDQLIEWAMTLPRRRSALLVNGLTRRELGCRLKGKMHKIIPVLGEDPNLNVVSLCDEHLDFELALRSD
jgi:hypothetical protein